MSSTRRTEDARSDLNASYTQNGTEYSNRTRHVLGSSVVTQVIPGGVFDAFRSCSLQIHGLLAWIHVHDSPGNQAAAADFSRAVNERNYRTPKSMQRSGIELDVRNALTALQVAALESRRLD